MNTVNKIAKQFITRWQKQPGYMGALLTGSYATGTQTKFSDIDIMLVFSDKTDWKERGNLMIDGYVVEYFAAPVYQYEKFMAQEFEQGKRTAARMLVTGKIIDDPNHKLPAIKQKAKKVFDRKFKPLSKNNIELARYHLWDTLDGLKDLHHRKAPDFIYAYNIALAEILHHYNRFTGSEKPGTSKIGRFLSDKSFSNKYNIQQIPDKDFIKLFMKALKQQKLKNIEKLTLYVQQKMGGFNIDGWKLKSKAEK